MTTLIRLHDVRCKCPELPSGAAWPWYCPTCGREWIRFFFGLWWTPEDEVMQKILLERVPTDEQIHPG